MEPTKALTEREQAIYMAGFRFGVESTQHAYRLSKRLQVSEDGTRATDPAEDAAR